MKDAVRIKVENAGEEEKWMFSLCGDYCECPNRRTLLRIGSSLGGFANSLRSALNYTLWEFCETKLWQHVDARDRQALRRRHDFPCAQDRRRFDEMPIAAHSRNLSTPVYDFLERSQPYHQGNEWLERLTEINNQDKHEVIAEVVAPKANAVMGLDPDGSPHQSPRFFGKELELLMLPRDKDVQVQHVPFYYYPYGMFACKGGKWILFLVVVNGANVDLLRFAEEALERTGRLVSDLAAIIHSLP